MGHQYSFRVHLPSGYDGQVITQRSADKSYSMVSEVGKLRSDIVTCSLCFSVDLDVATFMFPSALNIDGGYAANSKANIEVDFS